MEVSVKVSQNDIKFEREKQLCQIKNEDRFIFNGVVLCIII